MLYAVESHLINLFWSRPINFVTILGPNPLRYAISTHCLGKGNIASFTDNEWPHTPCELMLGHQTMAVPVFSALRFTEGVRARRKIPCICCYRDISSFSGNASSYKWERLFCFFFDNFRLFRVCPPFLTSTPSIWRPHLAGTARKRYFQR